jgi:quinol monooxygenase YgiN
MLIVLADIVSNAADIDKLRQEIIDMQEASNAEPGCISYTFTAEIGDPNRIRVIEQWQSMDDLKAHFSTPHMATFQQAMGQYPVKSMDVKLYEVAREVDFPKM